MNWQSQLTSVENKTLKLWPRIITQIPVLTCGRLSKVISRPDAQHAACLSEVASETMEAASQVEPWISAE